MQQLLYSEIGKFEWLSEHTEWLLYISARHNRSENRFKINFSRGNMTSSWLYVCVMVLACEYMVRHSTVFADTDTSSCILSRAARDVLSYGYKYTSCRVIASDCARQSAALDSRNCVCVCSQVSATYRTDKKKCITNINVNSGKI